MNKFTTQRLRAGARVLGMVAALVLLVSVSAPTMPAFSDAPGPMPTPAPLATRAVVSTNATKNAPAAPDASPGLQVVETGRTNGSDVSLVYNGDYVTYTIAVTNTGLVSATATNINLVDSLPLDTLDQITCNPDCLRTIITQTVPNPLGGLINVTKTVLLKWVAPTLSVSDPPLVYNFRGRVVGRQDGVVFTNNVFVTYDQGSPIQGNSLVSTARMRISNNGSASLSSVPTWFSSDSGGTYDQAWGDYAREGVLDLALASSGGTTIYHNDNGTLRLVNTFNGQAYGVAWADVDNDGYLELITVGESVDHTSLTQGLNSIYHYNPINGQFALSSTFSSPLQLVRIVAADLNGDGKIDLIASTNAINAKTLSGACAVNYIQNDGTGMFQNQTGNYAWTCLNQTATAALAVGDFSNRGLPDVVLGVFPSGIQLMQNTSPLSGLITSTRPITFPIPISFNPTPVQIDQNITFLPYGFSVGDFDRDGLLDLAAAYPLQREARVYHNNGAAGFSIVTTLRTNVFWTPLSVDWGNFTGDGSTDLLVADVPPIIYRYNPASGLFQPDGQLAIGSVTGQVWNIHGVQSQPYRALSLALTDRDQSSMIFDTALARLQHTYQNIDPDPSGNPFPASGVALGDIRTTGRLDVVIGASNGSVNSRLYSNNGTSFSPAAVMGSGLGPQSIAVADMNNNGKLEIAVGSAVGVAVYDLNGSVLAQLNIPNGGPYPVAWGDVNGTGQMDLLVGTNGGPTYIFENHGGAISTTPDYATTETCQATSVAWADYKRDNRLGFAVGCKSAHTHVYRNQGDGSFALQWVSPYVSGTTSLAWADYDASGYPSLAVAGDGAPIVIYENVSGTLSPYPVWQSPTFSHTTSIAWGDWANNGYPALAAANQGDPVQVFGNFQSKPGQPRLFWVWTSPDSGNNTGLAWGDINGDGFQDLVVSSADNGLNRVYLNGSAIPAQWSNNYNPYQPLPHIPPYVTVKRPGTTNSAFFYSSAELLSGRKVPTVTVQYRVYAPDTMRNPALELTATTPISKLLFQYSLTGGATWLAATPDINSPTPITFATRLGTPNTFIWNAIKDQAISDNALFRVTAVKVDQTGLLESDTGSGISPPFRVRATTCDWPAAPFFIYNGPTPGVVPKSGDIITFFGAIGAGSGPITVTWDFGDGSALALGQNIVHSYTNIITTTYKVKMLVGGQQCPATRTVLTSTGVLVGAIHPPAVTRYLPFIVNSLSHGLIPLSPASQPLAATPPITDLDGSIVYTAGDATATQLTWSPPGDAHDSYRVYRHSKWEPGPFDLIGESPGDVTQFTDTSASCGYVYYVTVVSGGRESTPSTASYYSPACTR